MFARQSVRTPSPPSHLSHLRIGPMGDSLEKEADRVADRVLHAPQGAVGRKLAMAADSDPSANGGRPLDPSTREWFEPRFGYDFSRVRIHSNSEAADQSRSLGANAYTAGPQIAFGEGLYQPHSHAGRRLIAHELAHVVQQGQASPLPGRDKSHLVTGRTGPRIQRDVPSNQPQIPAGTLRRQPPPGLNLNVPQLNLGGHTLDGDTQAARNLLQSELTVGARMQPMYLGSAMTLPQVSSMLARVTPALTEQARWTLVQSVWWDKVSQVRQLPPISDSPIQVALPSLAGLFGGPGVGTGSSRPTLPTPQQAAANYVGTGLPDKAPSAGITQQGGAGAAGAQGNWQPSAGPQLTINISRGPGTPLAQVAGQRQYTLGDNLQVVFQDSTDAASRQYSAVAGGQALTPSLIDSKIVQLQLFSELLTGLSQMPGNFSVSMMVQWSAGAQLTLKFGPITVQLTAGFQVTAQQGQGSQPAAVFSATVGPTTPSPGSGSQAFGPRNQWNIGVGPPPPLHTESGDRQLGGGMLYFGGTIPGS